MIFAHLKYKEVKGFSRELLQEEMNFLNGKRWHKIPKGVDKFQLSSFHPHWKNESKKELRKWAYQFQDLVNQCAKEPSKLKYLFNANASIEGVKRDLESKFERINKYNRL